MPRSSTRTSRSQKGVPSRPQRSVGSGPLLNNVPEDVWRLIFLALYRSDDEGIESCQAPISPREESVDIIRRVCRTWRSIADRTPSLWQTITFGGPKTVTNSFERFDKSFARSGALLVSVNISVEPLTPLFGLIAMAMEHLPRIHSLKVYVHPECDDSSKHLWETDPMNRLPRFYRAPLTGLPLCELKKLEFDDVRFGDFDWLLLLLCNSLKLEELNLICVPHEMRIPRNLQSRLLYLPALRQAILELPMVRLICSCAVRTAVLDLLSIGNTDPLDNELPDISFAQSIKTFWLTGNFNDMGVMQLLRYTPGLRILSLQKCQGGDDLLGFWLGKDRQLVPELRHLGVTEGECSDAAVVRLLMTRSGQGKAPVLRVQLRGCPRTTAQLGKELARTSRGSWRRHVLENEMIPTSYVYHNLGMFHP